MYDLVVIGGGPGGYEAAVQAARAGRQVALVEERELGGTCLNAGCIPTKVLLRASRLFAECRAALDYGVEVESVRLNMPAVLARKDRIVGTVKRGVETVLRRTGVEVVRGRARLASRTVVHVGADTLPARNILIATGSLPAVPPIAGIHSERVLDSSGVLRLSRIPEALAIIGAGYIGLEFACFFASAGAKVTVFEMLPRLAAGGDTDVSNRLEQLLSRTGVEFRTACRVTAIEDGVVRFQDASGKQGAVASEYTLNATGRVPAVADLGLEEAGVDWDCRGIKTSDRGRTNVPGIWACGDVTGRRLLAHAASREGIVAVNNMLGKPDRMRYDAVPSVIYTHPEVASVGRTEDQLKAAGVEYRRAVVPIGVASRFLIENEGGSGIVKVLTGARYREILGVHAIGDLASEFIIAAAAMIETEMRAPEAAELVFPHPTVSEALREAILEAGR